MSVAVANTVADPVVSVTHHTKANWATALPIQESCWPLQTVKNGMRHCLDLWRDALMHAPSCYRC